MRNARGGWQKATRVACPSWVGAGRGRASFGIVKRKSKPFACSVFSKRQASIDCVLNGLSFGGGCVNQANLHCWIDSFPFGGVGNSGMGKHYGKAGFDALSNTRSMPIGNHDAMLDVFSPYAGKDIGKMPGVVA
ncbi:aldehyde dehydrogenase family protein [Burkholderia anthina]|uniref:aldehyde dehydrogenase family protein n=1 Tax=Burkholderia anthina TaxID=179879 RepID=UPI0015885015|nr:aldehyde dehydrogenase family protein [Burkholderia anthina]